MKSPLLTLSLSLCKLTVYVRMDVYGCMGECVCVWMWTCNIFKDLLYVPIVLGEGLNKLSLAFVSIHL